MLKILQTFIVVILLVPTIAKSAYDPKHLEEFNEKGICRKCDLSGADLSTTRAEKYDLIGSNLISASFFSHNTGASYNFSNIDGVAATFRGSFLGANFSGANLAESDHLNCNFANADFTNANIKGANFAGTVLYKAKITQEQLNSAKSLCNAILPDGTRHACP